MALTLRLDQRQTQALVMTPQLQQAIKLLQLSNLELAEYIAEELQENPMLECDEGEDVVGDDASGFESTDFEAAQPAKISTEAELDVDYGEPTSGVCAETEEGSGVFAREWSKASVSFDCASWTGSVLMKEQK